MPITSLNIKIIRCQEVCKISPTFPLTQDFIIVMMRTSVSKGPYKNTNRLRKNTLIAHKNQHTNALKILAFVYQLSSLDYHQFFEFKYQVSIKK